MLTERRGWRAWLVSTEHMLCSIFRAQAWPDDGPCEAECKDPGDYIYMWTGQRPKQPQHPAPQPGCNCGIHSYVSPLEPDDQIWGSMLPVKWQIEKRSRSVLGEVTSFGRVQEYEKGRRAEKAFPTRLVVGHPTFGTLVDTLGVADRYGVPVVSWQEVLEEWAEQGVG